RSQLPEHVRTAHCRTGSATASRQRRFRHHPASRRHTPVTMSGQPCPRVSVLGAGSWGTALAVLATARADTLLWARNPDLARTIAHDHANPHYLPGTALPTTLKATADFQQAVAHVCSADDDNALIILGVPVAGLASLCQQLAQALTRTPPRGKLS